MFVLFMLTGKSQRTRIGIIFDEPLAFPFFNSGDMCDLLNFTVKICSAIFKKETEATNFFYWNRLKVW